MIAKEQSDQMAQRIAEAVAWHTHLHESDLSTVPEFEAWLKDAENARVWALSIAVWEFVGSQAKEPEVVAARTEALNLVKRAMVQRRSSWSWRRPAIAAAVALFLGGTAFEGYVLLQQPADYMSGFGERRVIRLEDGSRVSLDSDSEVTVQYSRTARELQLLRGQARFDVAHDVQRPFSVLARDQKVVATGTAFNVDITRPTVAVTLIEGHVVIFAQRGEELQTAPAAPVQKNKPVELRAGQELVASISAQPVVKPANIQEVTAWTAGQLIFSNEALSEVVARVNHYSSTPIVIADPEIGHERVSGVFNTGDVSGFLDIVTQVLPLQVSDSGPGGITLKRKS